MSPIVPGQLPAELLSLLALHSSFLTALSLHYAHNGTSTPADLRDLTASATKVWRQRQVTCDDIRLLIGVLDHGPSGQHNPYYLSDYGRGKICVEIKDNSPLIDGMTNVNEQGLQNLFKDGLDSLWAEWRVSHQLIARPIATPKRGRGRPKKAELKQTRMETFLDDVAMSKFVNQLPLADITTCASLTALAPLQEKGRKRLREFKESVQQGRSQKKTRPSLGKENEPQILQQPAQPKITEFAAVRKANLLDRILAKQEAAKCGPAAPTPAELQRTAALQRAPEVLRVLSLLCASKPGTRVSFSTTTLIQALQGSIRSPISQDEAMKCIEVLSSELAPGYVSIVSMGALSSVVVNQAMRPTDVRGRLAALGVA
ncbi:hypothetical protein BDU57DRAFT_511742 [Ampelomyces quisqualis]|uniref:DNA replication factor Cdt1 C-terminal domain-containing protein n=1 Tax=Ampelomyces quisqualis TaxID=50730 RepID=A0A6A5QU23_AMPQU|nr:hypothetical protein BDU57DRAFT_511742 [Ampelomyces quisqualis]